MTTYSYEFLKPFNVLRMGLAALGGVVLTVGCVPTEPTASAVDGAVSESTVASIIEEPIDGAPVTLEGYITEPEGNATDFVFTDGTEEIVVEIYDGFVAEPNTLVSITGEIDLEAGVEVPIEANPEDVEIDVFQVAVANPQE